MQDRKVDGGLVLVGSFGLHAVEIEVAQWARGDHDIGAMVFGIGRMRGDHRERIRFVDGEDGESAAA